VEALLRASQVQDSFLELLAVETEVLRHQTDAVHPDGAADDELSLDFLHPTDDPGVLGTLGPYTITEVIGRGGMGVVLKARDSKLNRVVAIKVLAPELASNPMARKRFEREAHAAAAVVHQHVVTIHAVDEDRLPYLVMEYIDGQSLQEKIDREGNLKLLEILRIGQQVAAGLAAAHAHGLMHRDVKPANILLENGIERVRITDFGLARAVDDVGMTRTGEVSGTPQFMSPEQAQGLPMDGRGDLFSFGSVLYAMCTGRPPFRAETAFATARRVCDDTPRPIREVNPEIPEWLVAIIDRLLAKKPEERFQTAAEVADLLAHHLAELQHPSLGKSGEQSLPPFQFPNPKSQIRLRFWAIAAAVVVLLLAGISLTEATGLTQVVPTVIHIVTGEGTLLVEVNDPAVKITVEGDGGLVITGAGLEEIHLRPGSYKVRADKGGKPVPLDQELVTITRGGKKVVTVSREPIVNTPTAPITVADGGEWVQLFNGKDLTGWKTHPDQPGNWVVVDGVLTGSGPSHLFSEHGDYEDFHLKVEARINDGGNSGIYFRSEYGLGFVIVKAGGGPKRAPRGYEVDLHRVPQRRAPIGTLWRQGQGTELSALPAISVPFPPDGWFVIEILTKGKHIITKVNGTTVLDTVDETHAPRRGHIALEAMNSFTSVQFRRIEIRELNAFVLVTGEEAAERKFDTLAEAVQSASGGDTIEIRGNGPFATSPTTSTQPLVIRAGTGFQPVIRLRSGETDDLINATAALCIEGLELQNPPSEPGVFLRSKGAPLAVANCRFIGDGKRDAVACVTSPVAEVRNCEMLNVGWSGVHWMPRADAQLRMDNCVLAAPQGGRCVWISLPPEPQGVSLRLTRTTSITPWPPLGIGWESTVSLPGEKPDPARPLPHIELAANSFDAPLPVASLFPLGRALIAIGDLSPQRRKALVPDLLTWGERYNLYPPGKGYANWTLKLPDESYRYETIDRSEWTAFWTLQDTNALEGKPKFKGGNLGARVAADAGSVTPDDFRLREGSAGYRAGPDGKDLGADVDLVGPGPAYERWKKTPEYQQWLKDSGQLRAEAPKPEQGAFIRLGGKGVAELKFDTLAAAVLAASDGDVIEIRGNGPFVTEQLKITAMCVIRAGEGFRPVVKIKPGTVSDRPIQGSLLVAAPVVLEGLEFQPADPQLGAAVMTTPYDARLLPELFVANCRFIGCQLVGQYVGALQIHNSELYPRIVAISFSHEGPSRNVVIDNNIVCPTVKGLASAIGLKTDPKTPVFKLSRNLVFGHLGLSHLFSTPADPPPAKATPVELSHNIWVSRGEKEEAVEFTVHFNSTESTELAANETLLRQAFSWREQGNLYSQYARFLTFSHYPKLFHIEPNEPCRTLADWSRFWDSAETTSTQGTVRLEGGDVMQLLVTAAETVTPNHFRLRPDSAGFRAGKDGKDLGPDIDLVGPGPAYERWKKTPEYQQWLKETGQQK
jgi:serine/threonine protein kinase